MKKITLLLTGTVYSSNIIYLKRDQTNVRLNDYRNALNKWLRIKELNIVFVENSECPLENFNLKNLDLSNFEYITYNGQNFSGTKGKGFGELRSIDYAMKNSIFLKNSDYIIKCNGRYFFKRIHRFRAIDADLIGNFSKNLKYMDSRVFMFKKDFFYNYLFKMKDQIDDSEGYFFEHALAASVLKYIIDRGNWKRISFPLVIEGVSGTSDIKLNSFKNILIIYFKYYLRFLNDRIEF